MISQLLLTETSTQMPQHVVELCVVVMCRWGRCGYRRQCRPNRWRHEATSQHRSQHCWSLAWPL